MHKTMVAVCPVILGSRTKVFLSPEESWELIEFIQGMIDATTEHLETCHRAHPQRDWSMTIGIEVSLQRQTPRSSTGSPKTPPSHQPLTRPVPSVTDSFKNAFDPSVIAEEDRARAEN